MFAAKEHPGGWSGGSKGENKEVRSERCGGGGWGVGLYQPEEGSGLYSKHNLGAHSRHYPVE